MTGEHVSSGRLATRAAAGDHAAFTELVRRCAPMLKALLREFHWATDVCEGDDLTQEALLGTWHACQTFDARWDVAFHTYAGRFARRRMSHLARDARRRAHHHTISLDEPLPSDNSAESRTIADTIAAPEHWQPEIMSEIRHDLRVLAAELPQGLSSTEAEALRRIMFDEAFGRGPAASTASRATRRVRAKASRVLGYDGAPSREVPAAERRKRALEMLHAGHTQGDIGARLGVAQTTVSAWARTARAEATAA